MKGWGLIAAAMVAAAGAAFEPPSSGGIHLGSGSRSQKPGKPANPTLKKKRKAQGKARAANKRSRSRG